MKSDLLILILGILLVDQSLILMKRSWQNCYLQANKYSRKKNKKRKSKVKYFSIRSQRQNHKTNQSDKKLATINKTISRSESYKRMKSGLQYRVNEGKSTYIAELWKSSNNIQDKILQLSDASFTVPK